MSRELLKNYGRRVLTENTTGFNDRIKLVGLLESDKSDSIDALLAKKLLDSVADLHVRVDFGPITSSMGDITKFKGTANMLEILELAKNTNQQEAASKVRAVITILEKYKKEFQQGYYFNAALITLTYESYVFACLDATSVIADALISTIREQIGTANGMNLRNTRMKQLEHSQKMIEDIIKADSSGQLQALFKSVLDSKSNKNLIGSGHMLAMLAVGAALSVVPITRELIYVYYQSRVSITDYLDHQNELIKLNETRLQDSGMNKSTIKSVTKKQTEYANRIDRISDKIRVKHEAGVTKAKDVIKKEEKTWTLDNIQDDIVTGSINNGGISII